MIDRKRATARQRRAAAGKTDECRFHGYVPPAVVLTILMTVSSAVEAQSERFLPSIELLGGYDDNVLLQPDNEIDSAIGRVQGTLDYTRETERLGLKLQGRLDYVAYGDGAIPDEDKEFGRLDLRYDWERSEFRLLVDGRRDTTIFDESDTLDPQNPDTGSVLDEDLDPGLVAANIRRHRVRASPGFGHRLTETDELNVRYSAIVVGYDDDRAAGLIDYMSHELRGGWRRDLSERSVLNVDLQGIRYEASDVDREVDTVGATVGLERDFSEVLIGGISLGARYSSLEEGVFDENDEGVLFNAYLRRTGERTDVFARAERSVLPSGNGSLSETDQLVLGLSSRRSEYLRFEARARVFNIDSLRAVGRSTDRTYVALEPKVIWALAPNLDVQALYRLRWVDRGGSQGNAQGNSAFISVRYRFGEER